MQNSARYDLTITGEGSSNGGMFRNVKITGDAEMEGDVDCLAFKSTGTSKVNGHLKSTSCGITGTVDLKGNLDTGEAKITGNLNVGMKGVFTVNGLLNAGLVDMNFYSKTRIKEIGGGKIELRRGSGFVLKRLVSLLFLPSDWYEGTLQTDTIEGDDIYVEYTTAKVIRGTNVTIGPGCHIEHVEYANLFQKSNDSIVNNHTQM
jgi:cytoskeletal protein CcmA (bactofilin family)